MSVSPVYECVPSARVHPQYTSVSSVHECVPSTWVCPQDMSVSAVREYVTSTWVCPQYMSVSPVHLLQLVSNDSNTHSHLLVLELVHCLRMHSWNTALEMTLHTDRSRNSESLHQTLWDGTVPVQLNYTGHIWFWNKYTIFIHLWHKCEGTTHTNLYMKHHEIWGFRSSGMWSYVIGLVFPVWEVRGRMLETGGLGYLGLVGESYERLTWQSGVCRERERGGGCVHLCVCGERKVSWPCYNSKNSSDHPVCTLVTTLMVFIKNVFFQYMPLTTAGKRSGFWNAVLLKKSLYWLCQKYPTGSTGPLCHKNEMLNHYHASCSSLILQHNSWAHCCICPILANSTRMRKWK